jgi:general secretion pathway protein D
MVEDGGIIVLGGLISDEVRESKSQVPFLGAIPIIGELFKTRSIDKVKTNLMVFIRPRILRDGTDAAIESNAKYNYIRKQQLERNNGRVPLMPGESQPTLPALEQLVPAELLNPVRQAVAPDATPAQRQEGSSSASSSYGAPTNNPAPPPAPPTSPFGQPQAVPPAAPPPTGTTP